MLARFFRPIRLRRFAEALVASTLVAVLLAPAGALAAILPPNNPPADVPDPADSTNCIIEGNQVVSGPCAVVVGGVTWRTPALANMMIQGIDVGRRQEQLGPLVLPPNFASLGQAARLLAVLNSERTSRGLPAITGLVPLLNEAAAAGAANLSDPNLPAWPSNWGSVWGEATDLLEIWFGWMYDDGWNGSQTATENLDCTSAGAPGCWGHRDILLGDYGPRPVAGIAVTTLPNGQVSAAVLLSAAVRGSDAAGFIPAASLLGASPPAASLRLPPSRFKDVAGVPWAAQALASLRLTGVVGGVAAGRFGPDLPLTYAGLATMAGRLFGWPAAPQLAPKGVPSWAASFFGYAAAQGFLPAGPVADAPVPRGQVVALIEKAIGLTGGIPAAVHRGLLCGLPAGLDLAAPVTRAQAAVFLERAAWLARVPSWGSYTAQYAGVRITLRGSQGASYAFAYAAGC